MPTWGALVAHHKGVWVSGDRSTGSAPKDVSIACVLVSIHV
jgi:hypothetical protein